MGAWLVAMLVAVSTARAAKDEPRIAVPPIAVEGQMPSYLVQELATRLQQGLGVGGRAVEQATACNEASCWVSLAERTESTHVVRATISVHDRDHDVHADLIDGRTGEVIATVDRACDICGSEELGTTVEDVGDALRRKLASERPEPAVLAVVSTPAGATVTLDGAPLGTTPMSAEVPAGTHDIEVGKREYITQRRRFAFVDGVRQDWKVELVAVPNEARSSSGRPLRIAGWTAIGVGIAAVGGGIVLAVLDESPIRSRCSGENVDIEGHCKYRYNSLAGGVVMATVGAAVLGTGIALVIVDRRRSRERTVAVTPTMRGIAVSGRF